MSTVVDPSVLIADARGFAGETLSSAISEMDAAMSILQGLTRSGHLGGPNLVLTPPKPGDPGDVPQYSGTHFTVTPFAGIKPLLAAVQPLVLPGDPGSVPGMLSYDAPITPNGEPDTTLLQDIPAVDSSFAAPTAPDLETELLGIPKPPLLELVIPDAPVFSPPEFTGVKPVFNVAMPTDLDATLRTQYSAINPIMRDAVTTQLDAFLDREFPNFRAGMAAIEARLATYLAGGSALSPAIEDAIYNRTLDKTNADAKRATQEAIGKAARSGHTMFSPVILSQLQDLDQDRRNNNARAATEIAVKQAELEQGNLQFAVTQSANLRQMAMTASLSFYSGLVQINGQALEYARSVVDAVVKAFDIAAKYAETQARIYEAEADIYKAKLEGAIAILRAYEAQIRGLEAQVNVNRAQVDAYKARIEAVQAEANVYRSQVEAVVALAGLQRLKVELYEAKVHAYGAQVNAYTARWQGYAAAVGGQAAKMQASAEEIRGFQAKVGAYTETVRAKAIAIESQTKINQQLLESYKTDVEAFAALNRAEAEGVHAEVESYSATIQAFIAKATAISEHSRAEVANFEVTLRGLIAAAELYMNEQRETNRIDIARITGTAQVAVSAGEIYGNLSMAALSGMNSLAASVVTATA